MNNKDKLSKAIDENNNPEKERYYKKTDLLAEQDRQLATHAEKFSNLRRELDELKSSMIKHDARISPLEEFKNKLIGMSLLVNILVGLFFTCVGYAIRFFTHQ